MNLAIMIAGALLWGSLGFFSIRKQLSEPPPFLVRLLRLRRDQPALVWAIACAASVAGVYVIVSALGSIESFQMPFVVGALGPIGLAAGMGFALALTSLERDLA